MEISPTGKKIAVPENQRSSTRRLRSLLDETGAGIGSLPTWLLALSLFAAIIPPLVMAETNPSKTELPAGDIIPRYAKVNTQRTLLSPDEVTAALLKLPGWKAQDGKITKTFVRKSFRGAIAFIDAFAPECDQLDHHPEIFNVYNKVVLTLTTFDAGQKISTADILLAERIEAVAAKLNP